MPAWEYRKIDLNDVPRKSGDVACSTRPHGGWDWCLSPGTACLTLKPRAIGTEPKGRKCMTTPKP